jgi:hypothetical protein
MKLKLFTATKTKPALMTDRELDWIAREDERRKDALAERERRATAKAEAAEKKAASAAEREKEAKAVTLSSLARSTAAEAARRHAAYCAALVAAADAQDKRHTVLVRLATVQAELRNIGSPCVSPILKASTAALAAAGKLAPHLTNMIDETRPPLHPALFRDFRF